MIENTETLVAIIIFLLIIPLSLLLFYIMYLENLFYILKNYGRLEFENMNGKVFYLFWKRIILLTDPEDVSKILRAQTELSWFNNNFNELNNLKYSINNYNTGDNLWEDLHHGLLEALSKNWPMLEKLFEKHKNILLGEYSYIFEKNMEKFLLNIWIEFMYGNDDIKEFKKIRKSYSNFLEKQFHSTYNHFLPFYFFGNHARGEILEIQLALCNFLKDNKYGVFYDLREYLDKKKYINGEILVNNAQLSILVFDFVYQVVVEYFKYLIEEKRNICEYNSEILNRSIRRRFFFPLRLRKMKQNILVKNNELFIKSGDLCIIDLKNAELYFSDGPRRCVGKPTVNKIIELFHKLFENVEIELGNPNESIYEWENNRNYPITKKETKVILTYPRDYAKTLIQAYQKSWDNGVKMQKFYDTLEIPRYPYLTDYLISFSQNLIDEYNSKNSDREIEMIVAPEVRGIPLAAAFSYYMDLPLYFIRKEGKLPGPVKSITYKTSYAENKIEINDTKEYKGKNVVLIDDGIAGGNTALACIKLLQDEGANVVMVIAIFNHQYKERCEEYAKYNEITYTVFDL